MEGNEPEKPQQKRRMSDPAATTATEKRHISFLPLGQDEADEKTPTAGGNGETDSLGGESGLSVGGRSSKRRSSASEGGRDLDFISDSGLPDESDFGEMTVRGSSEEDVRPLARRGNDEDRKETQPERGRRRRRAGSEDESSRTLEKDGEGSDEETVPPAGGVKDSEMDWSPYEKNAGLAEKIQKKSKKIRFGSINP